MLSRLVRPNRRETGDARGNRIQRVRPGKRDRMVFDAYTLGNTAANCSSGRARLYVHEWGQAASPLFRHSI